MAAYKLISVTRSSVVLWLYSCYLKDFFFKLKVSEELSTTQLIYNRCFCPPPGLIFYSNQVSIQDKLTTDIHQNHTLLLHRSNRHVQHHQSSVPGPPPRWTRVRAARGRGPWLAADELLLVPPREKIGAARGDQRRQELLQQRKL